MREATARWAWFTHRVGGRRHLGVRASDGTLSDLGPLAKDEELTALARGDLLDLPARAAAAAPLTPAPAFDVPVGRPGKILCLGKNFAAHAAEFGAVVPEEPVFFTKLADTLSPHGAPIVLPHWVDTRIDHELELAVILGFPDPDGVGRKYVRRPDAMDLVAGYTILNDVTARTMQGDDRGRERPWLRSKSFDTFCPVGPVVVPATELDVPGGSLAMHLEVNGERRQESATDRMVVDIPHAIEFLSKHTTLRPGDILAMGTPAGVGPIEDGDTVTCWIEGIGTLTNPVVREPAPA